MRAHGSQSVAGRMVSYSLLMYSHVHICHFTTAFTFWGCNSPYNSHTRSLYSDFTTRREHILFKKSTDASRPHWKVYEAWRSFLVFCLSFEASIIGACVVISHQRLRWSPCYQALRSSTVWSCNTSSRSSSGSSSSNINHILLCA